jgi:RNA polymerase-associated protein
VLTLYDAARCPYCARVRIVLAEKSISYETVAVDLDDRPRWIYDLNPSGRVPVLDDDGRVLPESHVIMEYLEDRVPEPPLLPGDPMGRALVRLLIERFGETIGDAYYARRRDRSSPSAGDALDGALDHLDHLLTQQPYLSGAEYGLADCAYAPWVLRAEAALVVDVRTRRRGLQAWLERLEERPAIAAEIALGAVTR